MSKDTSDRGGVEPAKMLLPLGESYNRKLITPYLLGERQYHLLFYKDGVKGPFYVTDAAVQPATMVYLGEIRKVTNDALIGNCFYTQAPAICAGSFLLAYSGLFKQSVNNRVPKDFSMDLVLKTPRFLVFNTKNRATLVVSPTLKSDIRQNLEI
jgi:hypothetical protein